MHRVHGVAHDSGQGHDERLRGAMACLFLGTGREIYQLLGDEKLALETIGEGFFSFFQKNKDGKNGNRNSWRCFSQTNMDLQLKNLE